MTISRAQTGSQLKGNKMACGPKKMKNGGMLAMISPAAAMAKSMKSGKAEGILGMGAVGALANAGRKKGGAEARGEGPSNLGGPKGVTGMKSGGKVNRGDGACMKGHTKGKMR
jgi:hypothetical protein